MNQTGTYFIDPRYLEKNPVINEMNVLDYFRTHPDYDHSCINEKLNQGFEVEEEENGVYYSVEVIHMNYMLIKKEYKEKTKKIALNYYIVIDNKVFSAPNFKEVLKAKIENITNLIHKMTDELVKPL